MSRHRIPPRVVFKSPTSFTFPDRQIHSIDKQWHLNPERTSKCKSLLHWPSPLLTCWRKFGENTSWFPPFCSNGPVALGIFPSIVQVWHAAVTVGSFGLTSIMSAKRRAESDSSVLFAQTSKTILVHYSNYLQVSGWISPLMKEWCFLFQNRNCKIMDM